MDNPYEPALSNTYPTIGELTTWSTGTTFAYRKPPVNIGINFNKKIQAWDTNLEYQSIQCV